MAHLMLDNLGSISTVGYFLFQPVVRNWYMVHNIESTIHAPVYEMLYKYIKNPRLLILENPQPIWGFFLNISKHLRPASFNSK